MSSSEKFKILFDLYQYDQLIDYLVPYTYMHEVSEHSITLGENYILRSALKNETAEELNSGLGLSIEGIGTYQEFIAAREVILRQENLDFAILQPYWRFEKHLTLLLDGPVFYGDVLGEKKEFVIQTCASSSGDKQLLRTLNVFIQNFSKYIKETVILELGIKGKELKLFQVNEVKNKNIKRFFHHELFYRASQAQKDFNKASFFKKLQIEFKAKKFRVQNPKVSLGNILENWLFIFHYYRLFCIQKKIPVGNISFEKFLNSLNHKTHLAHLAAWHVKKANEFRMEEDLPAVDSYFDINGVVYLGKGRLVCKLGETAIHLENLDAQKILQHKDKLILSTYNAILGHPCLLMAQENINFVGGLSREQLQGLSLGDEITVDFNLRKLEVKSF